MDEPATLALNTLLAYLINLATSFRYEAIAKNLNQHMEVEVRKSAAELESVLSFRSLRAQLKQISTRVAQSRAMGTQALQRQTVINVPAIGDHLVYLFCDDVFQEHLADWLIAWDPLKKKGDCDLPDGGNCKSPLG